MPTPAQLMEETHTEPAVQQMRAAFCKLRIAAEKFDIRCPHKAWRDTQPRRELPPFTDERHNAQNPHQH